MNLPYIKKISEKNNFKIWYVDGSWIRKNLEIEFTNFAQHLRFNFIPENEFWIDREFAKKEYPLFIEHLLTENKLMSEGKSYETACEIASEMQKNKRNNLKIIKKIKNLPNQQLIKKIHKKLLKKYSNNNLKVWIINGFLVRSLCYIDFTEGGHDKVYDFVPENEIWIDDALNPKEIEFVLLHEAFERALMNKGLTYNEAHEKASALEKQFRNNPGQIKLILKQELAKNY